MAGGMDAHAYERACFPPDRPCGRRTYEGPGAKLAILVTRV